MQADGHASLVNLVILLTLSFWRLYRGVRASKRCGPGRGIAAGRAAEIEPNRLQWRPADHVGVLFAGPAHRQWPAIRPTRDDGRPSYASIRYPTDRDEPEDRQIRDGGH